MRVELGRCGIFCIEYRYARNPIEKRRSMDWSQVIDGDDKLVRHCTSSRRHLQE